MAIGFQFTHGLRALADRMEQSAQREAVAVAQTLASAIAANAPVDEGDLRRSVRVESGRNGVVVKAGGPLTTRETRKGSGAFYDYSLATEFGTHKEEAEPFFYSTFRAMQRGLRDRIADAATNPLKM